MRFWAASSCAGSVASSPADLLYWLKRAIQRWVDDASPKVAMTSGMKPKIAAYVWSTLLVRTFLEGFPWFLLASTRYINGLYA